MIQLDVDAREAAFGVFHTHEIIPARPGKLTLSFPKWTPGNHGPTGPINEMINLTFKAAGRTLEWRRDDVNMLQFHLEVPKGADSVEVHFDIAAPARADFTPNMARLHWLKLLLYPTGSKSDQLLVNASASLPAGWKLTCPLLAEPTPVTAKFPTVSLRELADSQALMGANLQREMIGDQEEIDIFTDLPESGKMGAQIKDCCKHLVTESQKLFGSSHYRRYNFLLTLTDQLDTKGVEHQECTEVGMGASTFENPYGVMAFGELMCHEFMHSWNGKYRCPAGLATSDYDSPMKGDLLWVYEGMTQYLGKVMATRTGFETPDQFRNELAITAANMQCRYGRSWRSVEDTSIAAQILRLQDVRWRGGRRGQDYYEEMVPIWLEVDSIIRLQSRGAKSLNDFTKDFFGGPGGQRTMKTYTFDDLVRSLNGVTAYDWASLFRTRTRSLQPQLSLAGIENSGWKFIYDDKPWTGIRPGAPPKKGVVDNDAFYTIGARIDSDGTVTEVHLDMAGGLAGLRPGMKVAKVNGMAFSNENFLKALASRTPLELEVSYGGSTRTLHVAYAEGPRYPHLVRDETKPDLLSEILKPLAKP
ncbi:MAG: M61 family peptidase [Armatimonadetes bacterium]|nr:M61 family peptidase [Armatimonadota bacterium]